MWQNKIVKAIKMSWGQKWKLIGFLFYFNPCIKLCSKAYSH